MDSSLHRRWFAYFLGPVLAGDPPLVSMAELEEALRQAEIPTEAVSPTTRQLHDIWSRAQGQGETAMTTVVETVERLIAKSPGVAAVTLRASGAILPVEIQLRIAAEAWLTASAAQRADMATALRPALAGACCPAIEGARSAEPHLTISQSQAFEKMGRMASAYFAGEGRQGAVRARWIPLLAGPSGLGKTFLAERVAATHGATFHRIALGHWVPVGAREAEPMLVGLLRCLEKSVRCVVLLDEFDKLQGGFGTSWQQGVFGELFSLLDRELPLDMLLRRAQLNTGADALGRRLRDSVFFICAGTWQHIWHRAESVGFSPQPRSNLGDQRRLVGADCIPAELLLRCHLPPIRLDYPTPEESRMLFDVFGITALAAQAGCTLVPEKHDWLGGIRSLENLVTELWLASTPPETPRPDGLSVHAND